MTGDSYDYPEKPKRRPTVNPDDFPCPICGERTYIWGLTVGESPRQRLYSRPNGAGWGEGAVLYTRECTTCGNVQLFTTPAAPT